MTQIALPLTGTCQCGATRIRVSAAPIMTAACHCPSCQRMASSAFSLTAMFKADTFEVVQGDPVIGGRKAPERDHCFCPECLTWMFTRIPDYGMVNVRPTMFDDTTWFVPFIETWTKTRMPWVQTPAAHSFDEFPPMDGFADLIAAYAGQAS